ncbi:MAG: hypothetical protein WCA84_18630 [Ignavibacteriaceae bacterium]|jgi:hypothetical protein
MDQQIQNILIITDVIFTAILVFYFSFRSQANMKEEFKDKWLSVMNGSGNKEWFTEKGWSVLRKSGFTILFGTIILILIIVLSSIINAG